MQILHPRQRLSEVEILPDVWLQDEGGRPMTNCSTCKAKAAFERLFDEHWDTADECPLDCEDVQEKEKNGARWVGADSGGVRSDE